MNSVETRKHSIDPRTGLFLLILANIIAFTQNSVWVEFGWNFTLVLLLLLCGCVRAGFKWLAGFGLLLGLQWFVLPVSPVSYTHLAIRKSSRSGVFCRSTTAGPDVLSLNWQEEPEVLSEKEIWLLTILRF